METLLTQHPICNDMFGRLNCRPNISSVEETDRFLRLSQLLDRDSLMRFAYIPFVIASLAWDYADTVVSLASNMKISETKKLSRTVRELKREYDRVRAPYIDSSHQKSEEENMYVFEDAVSDLSSLYLTNIECDLQMEYPDLNSDSMYLLKAVYHCHLVLQSIYDYVAKQKMKIEKIVGHTIGDVLPSELRRLDILIMAFVGDKPVSPKFRMQQRAYAVSLSDRMLEIELTETRDE